MVVLQLTFVSDEFFKKTPEQRIAALDAIAAKEQKRRQGQEYTSEGLDDDPFPEWVHDIVEKLWKKAAKWDDINGIYQVAFKRRKLADKAYSDFKVHLEKACKVGKDHKEKKKWCDNNHLNISIRDGIGAEVLQSDEDLADAAEEL